ncbi:MAG: His/Gly/Thr/Pro-type tRNA ligase C-terminal domain-containing protein, partial [Sphingomicrobium sp.]
GVILKLNTLGDPATRAAWRDALYEHFAARRNDLSEDSRDRLERNPLRILDSKAHSDWPIADSAPPIDDFLTAEASDFFAAVTTGLDAAGVAWERAPRLVRGLDYYRHTAFEFITDRLGSQGTVLAGGRYDGLIESLGGPHTPAIGWAAGIERLAMMIDAPSVETPTAMVVPMGETAEAAASRIVADLRRSGIAADCGYRGSMKKRLQRANAAGARFALIIGDSELEAGGAQVKELETGDQRLVMFGDLAAELRR